MDLLPAPAAHVEPEVPVTGIDNNHGADIDVETVPKTSFSEIDIPLAATQLAQAAGRLIRSRKDSGVVAILDPRLATKGYGKKLVSTLPPMKRTIEFSEVVQFLKSI